MEIEEIKHLARLARVALTDEEIAAFKTDAESILGYVAQVQELSFGARKPVVGAHANPLRADEPLQEPGTYSDAIIAAFPKHSGRHNLVKKILSNDNA